MTVTHGDHSKTVWPQDVAWSWSWKRMRIYLPTGLFIASGLGFSSLVNFYLLNYLIPSNFCSKPLYL